MTVRHFDGVDDSITVAAAGQLAAFDGGPGTLVMCWRSHNPAAAQSLIRMNNAAGTNIYSVNPWSNGEVFVSYAGAGSPGAHTYADEAWHVAAFTKASGNSMARSHRLVLSTGVWTHNDVVAMDDSVLVPDHMWIGKFLTAGEFLDGDIAGIAIYDTEMDDAAVEAALTTGFQGWLVANPIGMWVLTGDESVPLVDLTGNGSDQTAITGTTAVDGEDPPNFNLSIVGPPSINDLITDKLQAHYNSTDTGTALLQRYRAGDIGARVDGVTDSVILSSVSPIPGISADRIFVAAEVTMDDWTPSETRSLIGQYEVLFNLRSWLLQVTATGALLCITSPNGSTDRTFTSTAATGFTDGTRHAVGVDIDMTDAGNRTCTFYTATSIEAGDWVQLGDPVSQAGEEALNTNTVPVCMGGHGAVGFVGNLRGVIHGGQVKNGGVSGTVILYPRFDALTKLSLGGGQSFPDPVTPSVSWVFDRGTAPAGWMTASAGTVYTNNHPDFAITDLDVRAKVSMADWTPATTHWIINHGNHTDTVPSLKWTFSLHPNGALRTFVSVDGTLTGVGPESTVATGFTNGTEHYIRCTVDADDGAGNSVFNYYESLDDGESWVNIGDPIVEATGPVVPFATTAKMQIGRLNPGTQTLKYAELRASIDGPIIMASDFESITNPSFGYQDPTGKLWLASTTGPRMVQLNAIDDWDEYVAHVAGASASDNFVDDQYAFWDAFVP